MPTRLIPFGTDADRASEGCIPCTGGDCVDEVTKLVTFPPGIDVGVKFLGKLLPT